jgi:hypothetical protein
VGAIDASSAIVTNVENVPAQFIKRPQITAAGPPPNIAPTEVTKMLSHEIIEEHENPRIDMNPKLRIRVGFLPSRRRPESSLLRLKEPPETVVFCPSDALSAPWRYVAERSIRYQMAWCFEVEENKKA